MDDNTGAGGTQADPTAQPQAGATQQAQAASAEPDTLTVEEARKLRSEARNLRERLKQLEEKDLPEAERRQKRLSELEASETRWTTERQDLQMEASAVRLATKLGFADADDALGWLARNRGKVTFSDEGRPTNLEHLLKELLREKPHYLAETSRSRGTAEGGARGVGAPVDFNAALRRAAGR